MNGGYAVDESILFRETTNHKSKRHHTLSLAILNINQYVTQFPPLLALLFPKEGQRGRKREQEGERGNMREHEGIRGNIWRT